MRPNSNKTSETLPTLIVGQGLAGSTLAWHLIEQAPSDSTPSVVVADSGQTITSSRIAAGLLTPITGKRFMLSDRWDKLWPLARSFYRKVEQKTGVQFLKQIPAWRLFLDEGERSRFKARHAEPNYAERTEPLSINAQAPSLAAGCFDPNDSGFAMLESARLDSNVYLNATRNWLEEREAFHELTLDPDTDLEIRANGIHCQPLDRLFKQVIFCQGYQPKMPCWLSDLRLQPAAGEILTVELPGLEVDRVLHAGVWLVPFAGEANTYRLGATHRWEDLQLGVTKAGRDELLRRLSKFWQGEVLIKDQQVAVRPTTSDRLPNFGVRADEPRIGWLNGLGAKGSLWAPWCAEELLAMLSM